MELHDMDFGALSCSSDHPSGLLDMFPTEAAAVYHGDSVFNETEVNQSPTGELKQESNHQLNLDLLSHEVSDEDMAALEKDLGWPITSEGNLTEMPANDLIYPSSDHPTIPGKSIKTDSQTVAPQMLTLSPETVQQLDVYQSLDSLPQQISQSTTADSNDGITNLPEPVSATDRMESRAPIFICPSSNPALTLSVPPGTNLLRRATVTSEIVGKVAKLRNKRGERDNPRQVYKELPETPRSWGNSAEHDGPLFRYTKEGEWDGHISLNAQELCTYIMTKEKGLTIWIQNTPAQYSMRYPNALSSKCRWKECPANKNTILKGFYRVCFDERAQVSGLIHDPFHNTGYLHLWCMEQIFDLAELVRSGYDVQPDTREFPMEEKNPMALTRDHFELLEEFEVWIQNQLNDLNRYLNNWLPEFIGQQRPPRLRPDNERLSQCLTRRHLQLESSARGKTRHLRDGNSLEKHVGDLAKFVRGERRKQRERDRAKKLACERQQHYLAAGKQ